MAPPVLRGISDQTYRQTLAGLADEGWEISKANSGHLKLTHPDASRTVFASFTPSDFRVSKKIQSECRAVLRTSGNLEQFDGRSRLSPEECDDALKRNKRKNKKSKAHRHMPRSEPLFDLPDGMKPSTAIPRNLIPNRKHGTMDPLSHALAKSEEKKRSPKPSAKITRAPRKETPKMTTQTETPASTAAEIAPQTPSVAASAAVQAPPVPPALAEVPSNVTALPRRQSAVAKVPGVTTIPADVLALARKIAEGSYQQMVITPEMVGQTLLFDGEVMLTGDAAPASATTTAAAKAAQTPAPGNEAAPTLDAKDDKLLASLATLGPDLVLLSEFSSLVWEELSFKNLKSANAALGYRLRKLVDAGLVVEGKINGRVAFKRAA